MASVLPPRDYETHLKAGLYHQAYRALDSDASVLMLEDGQVLIASYVDDLLVLARSEEAWGRALSGTQKAVRVKPPERLTAKTPLDFLGLQIAEGRNYLTYDTMRQLRKATDGWSGVPETRSSGSGYTPLRRRVDPEPKNAGVRYGLKLPFRTVTGTAGYHAVATRPDFSWPTSQLSRVNANPGAAHETAVTEFVNYMRWTNAKVRVLKDSGSNAPFAVRFFSDSDWAGSPCGASHSGFLTGIDAPACRLPLPGSANRDLTLSPITAMPSGQQLNLVSWGSARQAGLPALSSCEAELHALTTAAKESLYIRGFLAETRKFHGRTVLPVLGHCDNLSATATLTKANPSRARHINTRRGWVKRATQFRLLAMSHVPTKCNPADFLTKPTLLPQTRESLSCVGVEVKQNRPEKQALAADRRPGAPDKIWEAVEATRSYISALWEPARRKPSRPERRRRRTGYHRV